MPDKEVIDRLRGIIKELESGAGSRDSDFPLPVRAMPAPVVESGRPGHGPFSASPGSYAQKRAWDIPFARTETREEHGYSVITTVHEAGATPELFPPPAGSLSGFRSQEPCLDTLEDWLYLDIETTGLAGAATVAFLIGLGSWTAEGFSVDQYFLTSRQGEEAMLDAVAGALRGRRVLVTFNGKAFDVPVLQSRYVMVGMRPPLPLRAHLDFLSLTRSLGRRASYGQSLKEAVRRFTGVVREGDIPGNMVPALYFIYEREGDPSVLLPVIKHNRLDVVDMACLTWVFGHILTASERAGDPDSLAGAGKLHLRRGNLELARKCLETAGCGAPEFGRTSAGAEVRRLRLLAQVLRKQSDWEGALKALEVLVSLGSTRDEDYLNLSRCYEVGRSDLKTALEVISHAIGGHEAATSEVPQDLLRRKRRLERAIFRLKGK